MEAKPISYPYTRYGITYSLESQTENIRIVRCQFDGTSDWWEVSERKIMSAFAGPGNPRELYEAKPSDEAFGKWAWTCRDTEDVARRVAELEAKIAERNI